MRHLPLTLFCSLLLFVRRQPRLALTSRNSSGVSLKLDTQHDFLGWFASAKDRMQSPKPRQSGWRWTMYLWGRRRDSIFSLVQDLATWESLGVLRLSHNVIFVDITWTSLSLWLPRHLAAEGLMARYCKSQAAWRLPLLSRALRQRASRFAAVHGACQSQNRSKSRLITLI